MKKIYFYLLSFVLAFCACKDEIDTGFIPVEEQDEFMGELKNFRLKEETEDWVNGTFRLKIMTEEGKIITRSAEHKRLSDESAFKMKSGLKSGTYRLLSAEMDVEVSPDSIETRIYGLGRRIVIDDDQRLELLGKYDEFMGMVREDSAYIVSAASHLNRLREIANDEQTNKLLFKKNIYRQVGPIDMSSVMVDRLSGWMPIGAAPTTAFRGTFLGDTLHPIKNLNISRGNTVGVGLFGFVQNFTAKNVTLQDAKVKGHSFVGALAGAVVTGGDSRDESYFYNCKLENCTVTGSDEGLSVGGLVGMIDQFADVMIVGCSTQEGNCSGGYNVGGLLGGSGRNSRTFVSDCTNESMPVTGKFNCVGGLVGVADSLSMSVCLNKAEINGGMSETSAPAVVVTGTGGLVGGASIASLLACRNEGTVSGYCGVGGLVGSARLATGDDGAAVLGNIYFQQSTNSASVSGYQDVGGICGEAQFGGYGLYNKGKVSGEQRVGGLCGNASISVVQNAVNSGEINGKSRIGGLVGKTMASRITLSQNYGQIVAEDGYAGGIAGLAGNNMLIHYCANHTSLTCGGKGPTGGIVGEVGDPRKWSALDITYCVYGAIDVVMGPWCAAVDLAGFKIVGKVDTAINMFLAVSGFGLRTTFSYMEEVREIMNFKNCFDDIEFELVDEGITKKENEWRAETDNSLAQIRSNASVSYVTDNGLNNTLLSGPYLTNFNDNLAYCTTSEDNSNAFNEECNAKMNELIGEVKAREETKEFIHSAVSYITVGVGAVATAVSVFATAGTSAFVAATLVGTVSTFIGGANSVWRGGDNFTENAVIVSQCVNTGSISATDGHIGGIVGVMHDYCNIYDCINAGAGPGVESRQLVAALGNLCVIDRNLGIAPMDNWDSREYEKYSGGLNSFFYNEDDPNCLDKSELASADKFKKQDWNINGEKSYWVIPQAENPHPIPYWSEMIK